MPRPGTPVIHPLMLAAVQGVAETAMTSTCQLLRPRAAPPAFDPVTGQYVAPVQDELYSGPCRVQPRSRSLAKPVDAAGQLLTLADYQVTVPMAAALVAVDDLVLVLDGPDAQLTGRTLRITDVAVGDLQGERQLTCEDVER